MPSNLANQVAETWQKLVDYYNWQYIPHASIIIQQTIEWYEREAISDPTFIKPQLIMHYTEMLYAGLQQQVESAALDLQRACIQIGRRSGYSDAELEDFAADAVVAVIKKLSTIKPQTLLGYAFACMRNGLKAKKPNAFHYEEERDQHSYSAHDPSISKVEQELTDAALARLLQETLDNQTEFIIIYRSYFLDEKPQTIAKKVALKPEQVRLIKSRTLNKLRNNPQVMQVFAQLLVES